MSALRDRPRCLGDRDIELFFRQFWPIWPQLGHRLEAKQQPVETLQERVGQLPRNAGALAHSRLERHLEPVMQLSDPDPVPSPEQSQSTRRAERTKPGGLVIRWRDRELQYVALLIPHT